MLIGLNSGIAPIQDRLRSFLFAHADQRFNSRLTLLRNNWPHLHAVVEAVADAQLGSSFSNRIAECLLSFAYGDRNRHRQAPLSGTAKGAVADDLRGHGH